MASESDYVDLPAIRAEAKRLGLPESVLDRLPREHAVVRNRRVWGRASVFGWLAGEAVAGRRFAKSGGVLLPTAPIPPPP